MVAPITILFQSLDRLASFIQIGSEMPQMMPSPKHYTALKVVSSRLKKTSVSCKSKHSPPVHRLSPMAKAARSISSKMAKEVFSSRSKPSTPSLQPSRRPKHLLLCQQLFSAKPSDSISHFSSARCVKSLAMNILKRSNHEHTRHRRCWLYWQPHNH